MGCGASSRKDVNLSSKSQQKNDPIVQNLEIIQPAPNNNFPHNSKPRDYIANGHSHGQNSSSSKNHPSIEHFPPTETSLVLPSRLAINETNKMNQANATQTLPPPQSPSINKEEIAKETENWKINYDPKKNFSSQSQSLESFTEKSLLTPDLTKQSIFHVLPKNATDLNNIAFNEVKDTSLQASVKSYHPTSIFRNPTSLGSNLDISDTPYSPAIFVTDIVHDPNFLEKTPKDSLIPIATSAYKDQVEYHIKELHEQRQKMKKQRETDKGKSQQILKEKLKRRRELKKKRKKETAAEANNFLVNASDREMRAAADHVIHDLTSDPSLVKLAPHPNIPATKKEALYRAENIELFGDLENYAVSMKKLTNNCLTFADLMENLLIKELSDLEKVRILFHWITAQDLNSINFPIKIDEDTPFEFLFAIKENRKTYASLFLRLCGAAGLRGKLITGYIKGVGYYPDYHFEDKENTFRGSWNGVLVDGQWRLIDTNWGARRLTEEKKSAVNKWKTEYKYEEHFFLTDPDQLINTHFPDEPEWQLLQSPITLENFEKAPKLWPLFYKLKMQLFTHKEGIIDADASGYVSFQLKVSDFARTDARFKAELKPRFDETESELIELKRQIFHRSDNDFETFEIFLLKPGQYLFKVFGLSRKYSENNLFTNICFYLINCANVASKAERIVHPPFPIINSSYGINIVSSQLIALPLSHAGPIVDCDEHGQVSITFKVVSKESDIHFAHDLLDSSLNSRNQAKILPSCIVHSIYKRFGEKEMSLFLQVPQPGNFALALYSNYKNPSSNAFSPFLFYLISTRNLRQVPNIILPPVPNCKIGVLQPGFDNLSLTIKSCYPANRCSWETGIFNTDVSGECIVIFSHPNFITVIAELSTAKCDDLSSYATVETTGRISAITVRPPVQINKSNNLFCLKVYAAELDRTRSLPSVYVAFIFAQGEDGASDPLPQSSLRSWGPAGAMFFKNGLKTITYHNSSSCLSKAISESEVDLHGPTRTYGGGEDFILQLDMDAPIRIQAKLQGTGKDCDGNYESFVFLEKADTASAFIRVRFVKSGTFSLIVYGSVMDDASGQLSPLVYTLVKVTSFSTCTLPFPVTFNVWGSSARHLYSPLQLELNKNQETALKIFLANYKKTDSGWQSVPYSDVVALVDEKNPIPLSSSSNCEYEWKFLPGCGEKVISVLAKLEEDSKSLTYVMQFKID